MQEKNEACIDANTCATNSCKHTQELLSWCCSSVMIGSRPRRVSSVIQPPFDTKMKAIESLCDTGIERIMSIGSQGGRQLGPAKPTCIIRTSHHMS